MRVKLNKQLIKDEYSIYCGDCCKVVKGLPDESVGFSVFSPPFCNLYSYSDDEADMGNSKGYEEFFDHFSFLIKELHRITKPGRNIVVHCMDLPVAKQNAGYIGIKDFPGDLVRAFEKLGFIFHARFCVWKDPLLAAVRTKALGLAHKQIIKDSVMCRTGILDYVLVFRKPGENTIPVQHSKGLTEYYGSRKVPKELDHFLTKKNLVQKENKRSHWIWQQYASPVWFDIRQGNVLSFRGGRSEEDQKHICPLQLDVIERCIALWSTEGDVVFTPFMGIGSEIYVAVKNKRKGIGIELKESYYDQAAKNLKSIFRYKRTSLLVKEGEDDA